MKLYLSSFRLGDNPQQLAKFFGSNKKIAIIPNAKDAFESSMRTQRMQQEVDDLARLGLSPEIIELRDYFGKENELQMILEPFAGLWVVGGNTFVLRVAMKESGFDEWIKTKVSDGDFVYAGYSAGICVLAPTLKGIDIVDNPQEVQEVYGKDVLWDGLHIVDYYFAPHFRSNHPESEAVEKAVEYMEKNNMLYKTLGDGEVLVMSISNS